MQLIYIRDSHASLRPHTHSARPLNHHKYSNCSLSDFHCVIFEFWLQRQSNLWAVPYYCDDRPKLNGTNRMTFSQIELIKMNRGLLFRDKHQQLHKRARSVGDNLGGHCDGEKCTWHNSMQINRRKTLFEYLSDRHLSVSIKTKQNEATCSFVDWNVCYKCVKMIKTTKFRNVISNNEPAPQGSLQIKADIKLIFEMTLSQTNSPDLECWLFSIWSFNQFTAEKPSKCNHLCQWKHSSSTMGDWK